MFIGHLTQVTLIAYIKKLREELGCNLQNYILKNHTLERYTEYFLAFLQEANQIVTVTIDQGGMDYCVVSQDYFNLQKIFPWTAL